MFMYSPPFSKINVRASKNVEHNHPPPNRTNHEQKILTIFLLIDNWGFTTEFTTEQTEAIIYQVIDNPIHHLDNIDDGAVDWIHVAVETQGERERLVVHTLLHLVSLDGLLPLMAVSLPALFFDLFEGLDEGWVACPEADVDLAHKIGKPRCTKKLRKLQFQIVPFGHHFWDNLEKIYPIRKRERERERKFQKIKIQKKYKGFQVRNRINTVHIPNQKIKMNISINSPQGWQWV